MKITILAIRQDKARFFCRVASGLEAQNDITFLSTRYHSYRFIKHKGFKVYMLQDFIEPSTDIGEFSRFKKEASLIESRCKLLAEKTIDRQFTWICQGFCNYFRRNKTDCLFIWNGSMMQGYLASVIAESFGIKKLFFEIGNFPNRIFVDEKGVNARSSLMDRDLSICPDYNQERLTDFLERHKASKEQTHIVPQVQALKKINWATLLDHWYNIFNRYPLSEGYPSALREWWQNHCGKRIEVRFDTVRLQDHDYLLLPLQVSIDSQIIRNSNISLTRALELALQEANRQHLDLFIKPHPVEANRDLFDFMAKLRSNNPNLYVVHDNTYQLIKHCRKVITINSTVGIEGLMYHKHVQVLGRALYKPYCQPNLAQPVDHDRINRFLYNYLFNCLQEGDFYKTDPINIWLS